MLSTIITAVASMGIDAVITQAVKFTAPEVVSFGSKVLTKVGSMAISYAIGKKVTEYIAEDVDDLANNIKTMAAANAQVVETKDGE